MKDKRSSNNLGLKQIFHLLRFASSSDIQHFASALIGGIIFSLIATVILSVYFAHNEETKIAEKSVEILSRELTDIVYVGQSVKGLAHQVGCSDPNMCARLQFGLSEIQAIRDFGLFSKKSFTCGVSYAFKSECHSEVTVIDTQPDCSKPVSIHLSRLKMIEIGSCLSGDNKGFMAIVDPKILFDTKIAGINENLDSIYIKLDSQYVLVKGRKTGDGVVPNNLFSTQRELSGYDGLSVFVLIDVYRFFSLGIFLSILIITILAAAAILLRYLTGKSREFKIYSSAMDNNEFKVYYQPIIDIRSKDKFKCAGVEALIRWEPAPGFFNNPNEFIPKMEACGYTTELVTFVLNQIAIDFGPLFKQTGVLDENFYVSVNLVATDFQDLDIVTKIVSIFAKPGLRGFEKRLVLEWTERKPFEPGKEILINSFIEIMRGSGLQLRIALDDLGAQNSIAFDHINLLNTFPFDIIKIDKIHTDQIPPAGNDPFLFIDLIAEFANGRYSVVVEGVERREQLDYLLTKEGITHIQGFYFSKPTPFSQFQTRLLTNGCADNLTPPGDRQ